MHWLVSICVFGDRKNERTINKTQHQDEKCGKRGEAATNRDEVMFLTREEEIRAASETPLPQFGTRHPHPLLKLMHLWQIASTFEWTWPIVSVHMPEVTPNTCKSQICHEVGHIAKFLPQKRQRGNKS